MSGTAVTAMPRWIAMLTACVTRLLSTHARHHASMMSNGTSSALNSERDWASIPMARGGLARLAVARLKSAGVPGEPLLRRAGLTPEVIAEPEERLSVRSQIALLDEAAIALKDDRLGFTLARDFDPRDLIVSVR